jgi:uncharacterized protein Usg
MRSGEEFLHRFSLPIKAMKHFTRRLKMVSDDFREMLCGFSLTTAKILYWMPDYRHILQTYIWQNYDLAPHFPALHKFLDFWNTNLDGPIFKVQVAHSCLIKPTEIKTIDFERLH